jgi:Tfp pilus tip-associated adhesin PilY1
MKHINYCLTATIILVCCLVLKGPTAFADDTCVFMVTADNVEPNIVVLLDNGAEMQHAVWHADYDNSVDYTPNVAGQLDVVPNGVTGNGFYNNYGYGIYETGGKFYLTPVGADLELITDVRLEGLEAADKKSSTWTINGNTITLPAIASTSVDGAGIIDNAGAFRYSKNYLNWIFFSGNYNGDGSDLPDKSRFYYAKKAIMTVAKLGANQAQFSIYNFTDNADGASNVQPLGMVVNIPLAPLPEDNTLDPNFVNNINNMGTVTFSPLAEGLARVGGYYGSPSSSVVGYYCQNNFVIVVSPGISSEDQAAAALSSPTGLSDYDGDGGAAGVSEGKITVDATTYSIPVNQNGSTYLDDVAYYLYSNDIVDYQEGFQNVMTYTIGFMGDQLGNLFLKNTSNNGNGNVNLYDTSHEEYGKYHYEAEDPEALAPALLAAVSDILSATSSFTAPVVPVTRTTSGNRIYMAFFKPEDDNFWEGNVTKFGISNSNEIIDANGSSATWPNGAIREDAEPYWQTKDWADPEKATYIHNADRNIYTYIGYTEDLADSSNVFTVDNMNLTAAVLGNPTHTTAEIINYVRGADVTDEDSDGDHTENRSIITGDVLHSEPLVFQYIYPDNSSTTMVFFGANDGLLHAVLDITDPNVSADNDETSHGTEAWGFIPPDQLHRLKDMLEGSSHSYYVDSSPKVYFHDVDGDGRINTADGDRVILVCGARKGGTGYFGLDVTDPMAPQFLWRIDRSGTATGIIAFQGTSIFSNNGGSFQDGDPLRVWDGGENWGPEIAARVDGSMTGNLLRYDNGMIPFDAGRRIGNLTSDVYEDYKEGGTATPFIWGDIASITTADPDVIIPELGESWSEPQFGLVKTAAGDTTGTPVFFIGGGYSSDHSVGKAVLAIDVFTGGVVRSFKNDFSVSGMDYSIASSVAVIDADGNGFVDKAYVGDLGGQLWRLGNFTDPSGNALDFPESDENILNWTAQLMFVSDPLHARTFYYPPGVTLENGYDLVFAGTGDREDPCNPVSADRIYSIKDSHEAITIYESDLVDVTNPAGVLPDLDDPTADVDLNGNIDQGWYIQLAAGEKVLAEGTIFYRTLYYTTFTPNDDVCMPGGIGRLYALEYKSGGAVLDLNNNGSPERSTDIGGGIPSKVVTVLTDSGSTKLFISVGSTNPDENSESFAAGVVGFDPLAPEKNFFYLWWRELLNI